MRENIIQKRKISAAICEEWLERDKVLSGRQKDAINGGRTAGYKNCRE